MDTPSGPYHRIMAHTTLVGSSSAPLFGVGQFQPSNIVVQGLDLFNFDLAVGARALVSIDDSGLGGGTFQLFQGIVYDNSQACFQWRGSIVVFPHSSIVANTDSGQWTFHAWGYVEPAYGFTP